MRELKRIMAFLVLSLLLPLIVLKNINLANAVTTQSFKTALTATVNSPPQFPSAIEDLRLTTTYELTYEATADTEFNNQSIIPLTIPKGMLGSVIVGKVTNAEVTDCFGERFQPILENNSIFTPTISKMITGNYYKLTLTYTEENSINFNSTYVAFYWYRNFNEPTDVTVKLPRNFTIVELSPNGIETRDGQYNIINWNSSGYTWVTFLPFIGKPTVKSAQITVDEPLFSNSALTRYIHNETSEAPKKVMGIDFSSSIIAQYIPFPTDANASKVQIDSVYDEQGSCNLLREKPRIKANSSLAGSYYIDYQNSLVWVYPHSTSEGNNRVYEYQVEFSYPRKSDNPSNNIANISFWEPYRCLLAQLVSPSGEGYFNITGRYTLTFILPKGSSHISELNGEEFSLSASEDNRPIVTFNYNSPINLPRNSWILLYDCKELKDFYVQQELNTVLLAIIPFACLAVAFIFLKNKSKWVFSDVLPTSALLYIFYGDLKEYLSFDGLGGAFVVLMVSEAIFAASTIVIFLVIMIKKQDVPHPS